MKFALTFFAASIVSMFIVYICFAFAMWNLDPGSWGATERGFCGYLFIGSFIMGGILTSKDKK